MKPELQNAKITHTFLGIEDHGFLTAFLHLEFDGSGQGFGGYSLGGEGAAIFIRRTLEVVGCEKWEDLAGMHCRALQTHEKVIKIGHIVKDVWFDPVEEFAKLREKPTGKIKGAE